MARPSLSMFFPCHNEAENLGKLLEQCDAVVAGYDGPVEVVIVDDGSTDATPRLLREAQAERPYLRSVIHPLNRGYGAALTSGFLACSNDLIFFADGDNQFRLDQVPEFVEHMESGADVVIGYRFPRSDPPIRRLNAWGWGVLVHHLIGLTVRDIDCAYKMFRREVVEALDFQASGALISTELLIKVLKCGYRIVELPVKHYPRVAGVQSGADLKIIVWAFWELMHLRRRLGHWEPRDGRAQREAEHFDQEAQTEEPFVGTDSFDYLSHPCLPENNALLKLTGGDLRGKSVLDLGCGLGEAAVAFALRGAKVFAVDVSPRALERAKGLADQQGVSVEFVHVQDHQLPFPNGTFDLVYGNGVLHHLELPQSLPEIHRTMAEGALGYFIEPTLGNPLISVYRRLAHRKRTADEQPLGARELDLIGATFSEVVVEPFQLATLTAFFKLLLKGKHPSAVSYWREPVLNPDSFRGIYRTGGKLDEWLKVRFPGTFSRLCWNYVILVTR